MLASVASSTLRGIDGLRVTVEVHVGSGLPAFHVVGLPDTSCREARDRVRAAINSSGLRWPPSRVTVNLAPSNVPKHGSGFDLAIAVGILAASGQIPLASISSLAFIAELGLNGKLRPVPGTLSRVAALQTDAVAVAQGSASEAALGRAKTVRALESLAQLVKCLNGELAWPERVSASEPVHERSGPDLADVAGHPFARKALEVAAAGGHNLLLIGPPGAGKSMLARRLPGLLPLLDLDSSLAASRIHSVAGLKLPSNGLICEPPFRSPHHTATVASLLGGGSGAIRPGEISCAHAGILFLDELGEFPASVLDALRQPLEDGVIRISRASGTALFPAEFCLVAAMNPCPCGLIGSPEPCRCSDGARMRYVRRLSGPLIDRIDLRVHVERPSPEDLLSSSGGEGTEAVRSRVLLARQRSQERGVSCNARLTAGEVDALESMTPSAQRLLRSALADGRLSARGLQRVKLVALTLADLAASDVVNEESVATALALRARPAVFESLGL